MVATFAPVTMRTIKRGDVTRRECDAVVAIKGMTTDQLRQELSARRTASSVEREQGQREFAAASAVRAAQRLRAL